MTHSFSNLPTIWTPAALAFDGNSRCKKTCDRCGVVKITVMPELGEPYLEWFGRDGKRLRGQKGKACVPSVAYIEEVPVQ